MTLLRAVVCCADEHLATEMVRALSQVPSVSLRHLIPRRVDSRDLTDLLGTGQADLLLLAPESVDGLEEFLKSLGEAVGPVAVLVFGQHEDPNLLLRLMRLGVRDYLAAPFDPLVLRDAVQRLYGAARPRGGVREQAALYSFLPAKAGSGTTTVAVNACMAAARLKRGGVLLADLDLNSGLICFQLKLGVDRSLLEAVEHAPHLDADLWAQLVHRHDHLDVLPSGGTNPNVRISSEPLHQLLTFASNQYQVIGADLSGNLERYSLEVMARSRRIYLVCTPELPSLHLAQRKYQFLLQHDLGGQVELLVNRFQKRSLLTLDEIERLVGLKVTQTFPNDYQGVHHALVLGQSIKPRTALGHEFERLARAMLRLEQDTPAPARRSLFGRLALAKASNQ